MRVYGWKLEPAPIDGVAQAMVDFGLEYECPNQWFRGGCKVHLYLTSATPNPRILYEGFDGTDNATVPDNQKVTVEGVDEDIGKSWASVTASTSVTKTLAPVAWKTKAIGQNRSVLVNDVQFNLPNAAGTSATVTSSTIDYDVTHVKFRQEQGDTDGELTLTIVIDAEEDPSCQELGLSVTVTQLGMTLKTVTNADGSPLPRN